MLTERDIQARLMVDRYKRNFVLPNYTPPGWYECDVFELTEAGYMREYEIKLTRGDFKADAEKAKRDRLRFIEGKWTQLEKERKHVRLAARDVQGPCLFWYVTPKGLLDPSEVPEWAGLIEADLRAGHRRPYRAHTYVTKSAPKLHNNPAETKVKDHSKTIPYYRMHSLFPRVATEAESGENPNDET